MIDGHWGLRRAALVAYSRRVTVQVEAWVRPPVCPTPEQLPRRYRKAGCWSCSWVKACWAKRPSQAWASAHFRRSAGFQTGLTCARVASCPPPALSRFGKRRSARNSRMCPWAQGCSKVGPGHSKPETRRPKAGDFEVRSPKAFDLRPSDLTRLRSSGRFFIVALPTCLP